MIIIPQHVKKIIAENEDTDETEPKMKLMSTKEKIMVSQSTYSKL